MSSAKMLYNAWRQAGFNDNQAKIMMAETGRENSWNLDTIFGGHPEPHDKGKTRPRKNVGLISWNGSRRTQLLVRLKKKGLYNNGALSRSQATLNEMANFAVHEINTNKAYAKTKKQFLDNPNVDYATAVDVLGRNYIRWRIDDPVYKSDGIRNRDNHYKKIGGALKSSNHYQEQQPNHQYKRQAPLSLADLQATKHEPYERAEPMQLSELREQPMFERGERLPLSQLQEGIEPLSTFERSEPLFLSDLQEPAPSTNGQTQSFIVNDIDQQQFVRPEPMQLSDLQSIDNLTNTKQVSELNPQDWQTS